MKFLGVVSLAVLAGAVSVRAGSYSNDFQGYTNGQVQLGNGTTTYLTQSFADNSIVGVFNSGSWQGYRLSQDNATVIVGQSILQLPDLDPGKAITGFTATFDLLVKNDKGSPADGFSLTFGNLNTNPNQSGQEFEKGALASSGSALAVTFITWNNQYVGARVNTTGLGSNIAPTNNVPIYIAPDISADKFRTVSVNYTTASGLTVSYGGSTVYSNTAVSGFTPQSGYTFGLGARTGGSDEDLFIDNVNISTIPEPGTLGMVVLGLIGAGVLARRCRRA
jgi:hypothetical protein